MFLHFGIKPKQLTKASNIVKFWYCWTNNKIYLKRRNDICFSKNLYVHRSFLFLFLCQIVNQSIKKLDLIENKIFNCAFCFTYVYFSNKCIYKFTCVSFFSHWCLQYRERKYVMNFNFVLVTLIRYCIYLNRADLPTLYSKCCPLTYNYNLIISRGCPIYKQ